jgi:3-oxoacyl-(acyl-carrier-protein) synthase
MSAEQNIFIEGIGAVSPAGWGMKAFREALDRNEPLSTQALARPGWEKPLCVRQTPAASPRPAFLAHARLRRTSPIAQFVVSAALEALGEDANKISQGLRLGIVYCAMSGCVNYSRRFYDEVLKDPATASPLVFPETVFNSPASHLAALLGTTAINYTIVGDPGTILQGLALAADWLLSKRVDGCLVVGAEEMDWLTADATRLFENSTIVSDGAGALYLKRESDADERIRLAAITDPRLFHRKRSRVDAARRVRMELASLHAESEVLCDGLQAIVRADQDEQSAWSDWEKPRLSVKPIFGEGFMAAAAWQCVAAIDALRQQKFSAATVNIVGCNEQVIAARFVRGGS